MPQGLSGDRSYRAFDSARLHTLAPRGTSGERAGERGWLHPSFAPPLPVPLLHFAEERESASLVRSATLPGGTLAVLSDFANPPTKLEDLLGTSSHAAFTLIELVLALAIAAVVLAAINAVFFGALRLRATTVAVAEQSQPVERAIETIKNDLVCIRPPSTNGYIGPMGTDATAVGMTQPLILELYTSSARISDDLPWGDVQKIDYWLQSPTNPGPTSSGQDLIRGVTRNLLATTPESPEPHRLLGNVQNLRFSYFDGTNWNDTWSVTLSNVPEAIKVFLTFTKPRDGTPANPPLQFVVPIITQLSTNM